MPATKTEPTETLTDDMITGLREEARNGGDRTQVEFCDLALGGHEWARAECAQAISNARAQDESTPYVEVVA